MDYHLLIYRNFGSDEESSEESSEENELYDDDDDMFEELNGPSNRFEDCLMLFIEY